MKRDRSVTVRVSVVIPTYNAAASLPVQLEALTHQTTTEPFEVLVSDNGSTDGLAAVIDEWQQRAPYPMRRVDASGRKGVSHARNVGVAASEAEFVLVCDADDAVHPSWIDGHLKSLAKADVTGGPTEVETLNPGPERFWRDFPPIDDDWQLPKEKGFLSWVTGANFGARRSVIEAIGGWDENLDGLGGDDLDFSWRAQLLGFTVAPAPSAVVSYRLRRGLRATALQMYLYTACFSALWQRFSVDGLTPPTFRNAVGGFAYMVWHFPRLLRGEVARGRWIVHAALSYGVVIALVRYRMQERRRGLDRRHPLDAGGTQAGNATDRLVASNTVVSEPPHSQTVQRERSDHARHRNLGRAPDEDLSDRRRRGAE
ncbi:glycosyltransferase family 2 protein [Humibacter sp. RRB41]|uniref:glycosyltransferase n=1 Tax=Humibacter sp. RRB41 TaxID=2919946 RepID=UPI001FA9F69D|nr:glycosyltransferase family A protein [Humibacter sp. RRB41]